MKDGLRRARLGLSGKGMAGFWNGLCPNRISLHRFRPCRVERSSQNNYFGSIYAVPVGPLPPGPVRRRCGDSARVHPCLPPQVLSDGNPNPECAVRTRGVRNWIQYRTPWSVGSCATGRRFLSRKGATAFAIRSYFNTDFCIMKNTKIPGWEDAVLGIGFQFFNLFNHPNFGTPDNYSSDQAFGEISYLEQPPTSILGNGFGGDVAPTDDSVEGAAQLLIGDSTRALERLRISLSSTCSRSASNRRSPNGGHRGRGRRNI